MKTKIVLFLAIALTAPLLSQRIFANITYDYTGNHFDTFFGSYGPTNFVTAMITLKGPLGANFSGPASPTAFTVSDNGVNLFTDTTLGLESKTFSFTTDGSGAIIQWAVDVATHEASITTFNDGVTVADSGGASGSGGGSIIGHPGAWTVSGQVADTGSTLSLMTLTLMALGLVARRFQRAAA